MAYKCRICGVNEVEHQGDICELCAIGQDPYAQCSDSSCHVHSASQPDIISSQDTADSHTSRRGVHRKVLLHGGEALANQDPYGNDMGVYEPQPAVQVYSAGQASQSAQQNTAVINSTPVTRESKNLPNTEGITKNISVDNQKKSILAKWFGTLFTGIPFTLDDEVTMFQVFPDFSGTSLNALGNACDQVIVYGKLNSGIISENNDVKVYGRRDSNNNIIAQKIINKASGTTISPSKTIGQGIAWLITLLVIGLLSTGIMELGTTGIVWTIVLIVCLLNLKLVFKVFSVIVGVIFSIIRGLFK